MRINLAALLGVGLLVGVPAWAHHSFAAEFDAAHRLRIRLLERGAEFYDFVIATCTREPGLLGGRDQDRRRRVSTIARICASIQTRLLASAWSSFLLRACR